MVDRDLIRLGHMLDCAQAIFKFLQGRDRIHLDTDRLFASAIARELEVFGEAASAISSQTRLRFPEVPWKEIVGMRNRLIHAYIDINQDLVWKAITEDLPNIVLKIQLAKETLQTEFKKNS